MFRRRGREKNRTQTEAEYLRASRRAHRGALRFRVAGPLLLGGLAFAVLLVMLAAGAGARGVNTVAALMSVCVTLPLVIVCFIPYIVLLAMTFGMAKLYGGVGGLARRGHTLAHRANLGTKTVAARLARPVVTLNAGFAYIEKYISTTVGERFERLTEPDASDINPDED